MILRHLSFFTALAAMHAATFAGQCGGCGADYGGSSDACCQQCQTCCPTQTCNTCQQCGPGVAGCSICGGQGTSNCCCAVSIDVDSLKDDAQSKKLYEASRARLIFKLPDDKYFVYLSGRQMSTPGKLRSFTVPVGDQKRQFNYEVKVDMVYQGQKYHKKEILKTVKAGSIIAIEVGFVNPNEEEGLPADITFDTKTRIEGGPPEDDEQGENKDGNGEDEGATADQEAADSDGEADDKADNSQDTAE